MSATNETLITIGAIKTLIEKFPLDIFNQLFKGKVYTSVMDFLIDLLSALGISQDQIMAMVVSWITGIDAKLLAELGNGADTFNSKIEEALNKDKNKSAFLTKAEAGAKYIIEGALSGVLSCAVQPWISNRHMDKRQVGELNGKPLFTESELCIPIETIDLYRFLNFCPLDKSYGQYLYDAGGIEKISDLYKSKDFNAFLWYVKYKGNSLTEENRQKLMWDNRLENPTKLKKIVKVEYTQTDVKLDESGDLGANRMNVPCLRVGIASETYKDTRKLSKKDNSFVKINKTYFEFNKDYLDSIELFSSKVIITGLVDELIKGIKIGVNVDLGIDNFITQAQIQNIIRKVVQEETNGTSDCYFTFSNEEYDAMLQEMENYRQGVNNGKTVDRSKIANELGEIIGASSLVEQQEKLYKTLTDIMATPAKDGESDLSINPSAAINQDWMFDMISSLVNPLLRAVLSPKIMFLFMVNYEALGFGLPSTDRLLRSLLSIIVSLIKWLVNLIIQYLMQLVYEKVWALVAQYCLMLVKEGVEDYMELLLAALSSCPRFDLNSGRNALGAIDDVDYADITQEKTTPNEEKNC